MKASWRERLGFALERFSRVPGWLWRYHGSFLGIDGRRWNRYINRVNGHLIVEKAS